jgi:DNA-binding transcriptional ArsR family regulator
MNAENRCPKIEMLLHVLGHLNRLRILARLRTQEVCIHTLADILLLDPKEVLRQVTYLRTAGLVVPSQRHRRRENFYTLAPAVPPLHRKLLTRVLDCLAELPVIQGDAARAEAAGAGGPLAGAAPRRAGSAKAARAGRAVQGAPK